MILRIASLTCLLLLACGDTKTNLVPDAVGVVGCTLKQNNEACTIGTDCCSGTCSNNVCASGPSGPSFGAGSLIIPMDLSYQSRGMFQAYGLIYQLLRQDVHVYWLIDPVKTWHATACNTPGDTCAWDCEVEGSGVKCAYPTASPDVFATTNVIWDDTGVAARGSALGNHGYRGGPFMIDTADHDRALAIIDAWNDQAKWATNPWAMRTVFHVTSVHETTAPFTGTIGKTMVTAPTIAVFADGNEAIATGYLRAAGIPQSNGAEFPAMKCGTTNCGPSTPNPDMLQEEQIAGDLGTCSAPNLDHRNGALFDSSGNPKFCQIMSMHWDVNEREKVQCDGGNCPATQAQCTNQKFTFNGHEVVAEVREFLKHSTHFFAECQAVNAYENTVPNPAWPYLDDPGRDGHFLTTVGTPPLCPANTCTDANYMCVPGACGGQACCMPKPATWQDLPGYEVAMQPTSDSVKVLRPDVPYNQFDGAFGTTGGSEPAYNLSSYLGTTYKNNRQVTLLTGANGPGDQDLWMSGYLDGCGDIILKPGGQPRDASCGGKISYLGGHQYKTDVPLTSGSQSQGTRLFLNALFEAECVTGGAPGFGDSDGDGVPDSTDPDPTDPHVCGDSDADGCDDCSTGHFDLVNDCTVTSPAAAGCCETGSGNPAAPMALGLIVLATLRRRTRSGTAVMRSLVLALAAGCGFAPHATAQNDGGPPDGGTCAAATMECVTADVLRTCMDAFTPYFDTPCAWGCDGTGGAHCAQLTPLAGAVGASDMLDFGGLGDTTLVAGIVVNSTTGEIGTMAAPTSVRGSGPGIDHGIRFETRNNVALFKFQTLKIEGEVALVGTRALALVASADITIDAVVDARGPCTNLGKTVGGAAGPGGFQGGAQLVDATGMGGGGGGSNVNTNGGGGGGHGGVGGTGGSGVVAGGPAFDPAFALLTGGGGGGGAGGGGGNTQPGGGGGGGVQLISNTRVEIGAAGGINAGGCGGFSTTGPDAGGGGGAGGTIIIEAPIVRVFGALAVNGGGGGAGPSPTTPQGENGRLDRVAAAAATGSNGAGGAGGAAAQLDGLPGTTQTRGGAGGAVGRMRINTRHDQGLELDAGAVLSPNFTDPATTCTRSSASAH